MASIRKRSDRWQVRVQRKGYPDQTKSFINRSDAQAWGRQIESEFDRGVFVNRSDAESTSLHNLLKRYLSEVTPHKKGSQVEAYRINAWLKHSLALRTMASLKRSDFARWRDERVKLGKSTNTIRLELAIISNAYNVAKQEWGFESLVNPVEFIRLPKLPKGRTRRVTNEELELICTNTDSPELPYILKLAVETAMRRGELQSLKWEHINFTKRTAWLPDTKNGESRNVPLSQLALGVLKQIPRRLDGSVFSMTSHAITYAFIRSCRRVGLVDIHLHDLRHEAVSRLFEKGLSLPEVASISGHKTWAMLSRYTHLKAENLAKKIG